MRIRGNILSQDFDKLAQLIGSSDARCSSEDDTRCSAPVSYQGNDSFHRITSRCQCRRRSVHEASGIPLQLKHNKSHRPIMPDRDILQLQYSGRYKPRRRVPDYSSEASVPGKHDTPFIEEDRAGYSRDDDLDINARRPRKYCDHLYRIRACLFPTVS